MCVVEREAWTGAGVELRVFFGDVEEGGGGAGRIGDDDGGEAFVAEQAGLFVLCMGPLRNKFCHFVITRWSGRGRRIKVLPSLGGSPSSCPDQRTKSRPRPELGKYLQ